MTGGCGQIITLYPVPCPTCGMPAFVWTPRMDQRCLRCQGVWIGVPWGPVVGRGSV